MDYVEKFQIYRPSRVLSYAAKSLLFRILYVVCYAVGGQAAAAGRSAIWGLSSIQMLAIFKIAIQGKP